MHVFNRTANKETPRKCITNQPTGLSSVMPQTLGPIRLRDPIASLRNRQIAHLALEAVELQLQFKHLQGVVGVLLQDRLVLALEFSQTLLVRLRVLLLLLLLLLGVELALAPMLRRGDDVLEIGGVARRSLRHRSGVARGDNACHVGQSPRSRGKLGGHRSWGTGGGVRGLGRVPVGRRRRRGMQVLREVPDDLLLVRQDLAGALRKVHVCFGRGGAACGVVFIGVVEVSGVDIADGGLLPGGTGEVFKLLRNDVR